MNNGDINLIIRNVDKDTEIEGFSELPNGTVRGIADALKLLRKEATIIYIAKYESDKEYAINRKDIMYNICRLYGDDKFVICTLVN